MKDLLPILLSAAMSALPVLAQTAITGRVIDSQTRSATAGAYVEIVPLYHPEDPAKTRSRPVSKPIDSVDGRFSFGQVDLASVHSDEAILVAGAYGRGFAAKRFRIADLPADFLLTLNAPVPIRGRVMDSQGRPMEGVTVGVVYEDPVLRDAVLHFESQYKAVDSDSRGMFETQASRGYSFVVEAYHQDYVPAFSRLAKASPGGEPPAPFQIRLKKGLEVTGKVVDGSDQGIGGMNLMLITKAGPPFLQSRAYRVKQFQEGTTAADGTFALRGVLSGDKELVVTDLQGRTLARKTFPLPDSRHGLTVILR